jgi:hypothetical protein
VFSKLNAIVRVAGVDCVSGLIVAILKDLVETKTITHAIQIIIDVYVVV